MNKRLLLLMLACNMVMVVIVGCTKNAEVKNHDTDVKAAAVVMSVHSIMGFLELMEDFPKYRLEDAYIAAKITKFADRLHEVEDAREVALSMEVASGYITAKDYAVLTTHMEKDFKPKLDAYLAKVRKDYPHLF